MSLLAEKWKSITRKIVKYFAFFVLVVLLIYTLFGVFLDTKHDEILAEVNHYTKENFKGDIAIGDLNLLLFRDFPSLTIELQNVTVKDSLWAVHKKTLIESEYLYAKIYPWKILFGNLEINKVTLKNATLDVYTAENGYSNFLALAQRKVVKKEKKDPVLDLQIDYIELKEVTVVADNHLKRKSINFKIKSLNTHFTTTSKGFIANAKMNAHIDDLTFNYKNGSFAKNKDIIGNLAITYDTLQKNIAISSDAFVIGGCQFDLKASFGIKGNSLFSIGLTSKVVYWKDAASLVSKNIFSKLNKFDLKKPFPVKCFINGDMKDKNYLKIHVVATFKDNGLTAVNKVFTNCSFTGEYTNNYVDNGTYDDPNSAVMLHDFKASYEGIAFKTKDLMVLDLKKPIASGSLDTEFDASKLRAFFTEDHMRFTKGKVRCAISFKSDVINLQIKKPFIEGMVSVKDCDFTFVPKNIAFKKNNVDLHFTSDELIVKNLSFETKSSKVQMKGSSKDFMSLYYDSPHKIVLNWEVYSPFLDLKDFTYFMSPSKTKTPTKKEKSTLFDILTNTELITAKVKVDQFKHNKFTGSKLVADVQLTNKQIKLSELSVNSCNGNLKVTATIDHGLKANLFSLNAKATNLDVDKFLYSFDNFGSKTITNHSIRGKLSLQTYLTGQAVDAAIQPKSLKGSLNYQLTDGAFVNFKPIEKVGKHVFPKRDFSNITIDNLVVDIAIKKGILTIAPMEINTSVIKMDVVGDYGLDEGTNLNIDVHLRNPAKDKNEISKAVLAENRKKGVCIHLQVIDDKKGGTKIKPRLSNNKSK